MLSAACFGRPQQRLHRRGWFHAVEPIIAFAIAGHQLGLALPIPERVGHVIHIGDGDSGIFQRHLDRAVRESGVHLFPAETFLGNRKHNPTIDHQADGGIFVERRNSQNDHRARPIFK